MGEDSRINRRLLPILGSLLLLLSCGDDPIGPFGELEVATTSLPNAGRTLSYSATLEATGGDDDYTWALAVGSLPTNLSLAATGQISGTPTVAGTSDFTVKIASGDGQTSQQMFSITVSGAFLDSEFAVVVESDIVYATGAVRSPTVGEIDLHLDVYRPADANLPALRPGFILIHGGGFTGGSKTNATMVALGNAYAARGYVAASISYRLVGDDPRLLPTIPAVRSRWRLRPRESMPPEPWSGCETMRPAMGSIPTASPWEVTRPGPLLRWARHIEMLGWMERMSRPCSRSPEVFMD